MKHTYISPTTSVTEVQLQLILALSQMMISSQSYDEETMTDLVKQSNDWNIWDDDWSKNGNEN